ncbi:hypothetical protein ABZ671_09245 [Micromonospora sp. NPDC006766]|uniref:hypothetical protein n=1 Tax=Micromonospora sp. NPDC006766 TaxID=3154778 RepID=UPI0033E4FE26
MLPIALTCPMWWVARWTARMLASLAVVVSCSIGAATVPIGPAVAAHAAAHTLAVDTSPLRAAHLGTPAPGSAGPGRRVLIRWTDSAAEVAGPAGTAASGVMRSDARGRQWGSGSDAVGIPVVVPDSAARRVVVVTPVAGPVLAGLVPAAVGSRAPPAR